jgi:hypothetical protein
VAIDMMARTAFVAVYRVYEIQSDLLFGLIISPTLDVDQTIGGKGGYTGVKKWHARKMCERPQGAAPAPSGA